MMKNRKDMKMLFNVYSVRDQLTGFLSPTCDISDEVAKRNFANALERVDLMHSNPKDYDLFKVGTFDSDTGKLDGCIPELTISGIDVVKKGNKDE